MEHLKDLEFVLSLDGCREIGKASGSEQAVSASPESLLEMQNLGPHPRTTESETGWAPSNLCFNKSSRPF